MLAIPNADAGVRAHMPAAMARAAPSGLCVRTERAIFASSAPSSIARDYDRGRQHVKTQAVAVR
jgi:hypothetical protein